MFSLSDNWHYIVLFIVLILIIAVERYQTKGLSSPLKELYNLRTSLIIFAIVTAFLYFTLPNFYYFSIDRGEIQTLSEAAKRLEYQDQKLSELYKKVDEARQSAYYFLFMLILVFTSAFSYAKALSKDKLDAGNDDMISIFDTNQTKSAEPQK